MQENESTELAIDYSCSTKGCYSPRTSDCNRYEKCFVCGGRFCDGCIVAAFGGKPCCQSCLDVMADEAEEEAALCPGECGGKGCADCVPELSDPNDAKDNGAYQGGSR